MSENPTDGSLPRRVFKKCEDTNVGTRVTEKRSNAPLVSFEQHLDEISSPSTSLQLSSNHGRRQEVRGTSRKSKTSSTVRGDACLMEPFAGSDKKIQEHECPALAGACVRTSLPQKRLTHSNKQIWRSCLAS